MGLSSKQVSSDGLGWSQTLLQAQTLELSKPPSLKRQQPQNHQQQQAEPLKCPRCGSTNTKFCYYNNYNKSQPRHFCKGCKRHWTKGGTLRSVPIGGGRKNKRLKKSNNSTNTTTTSTATITTTSGSNNNRVNIHMAIQRQQPRQNLPFSLGDQKNLSDILYMIHPQSSLLQHNNPINSSSLDIKDMSTNNGTFVGSSLSSLPQNRSLLLPYASSGSFDTTHSSISTSFQSSNVYNYTGEQTIEDSTIVSTSMPATWQIPDTSSGGGGGGMDIPNFWNWDDIDTFVSTDLNVRWDDPDIKP